MYCKKCGRVLDENNHCANCDKPTNVIFILALIAVGISVVAMNLYLMIFGVLFGLVTLVWELILYKKNHAYPKIGISIALSIAGIISNILWCWFYLAIL
jgi:hypothetical protein